jgi:hypothetical protein
MSKCKSNLCNHEACLFFIETLDSAQVSVQLAAFNKIHDEIDAEFVLEHEVHAHDERVLNSIQDVFFQLQTFKEVLINNHILSDAFHGVNVTCLALPHHVHLAEGSLSKHAHDDKILETSISRHVIVLSCEQQGTALTHSLSSADL